MANLVPIPWQPGYYLTPDTLAYLRAAGNKLGTNLIVTDAWRSYAEQAYYYDQYKNHGGNPASSPDTGLRQHMRGAAFDLQRTDATVQAACKSVGLVRDYDEAWHWNNPYWASMPIIPVNDTATAGGGSSTPIEEDDMYNDTDRARDNVAAVQIGQIRDALFKTTAISAGTTGGHEIPGGLLKMASIDNDARFQIAGEGGAGRDGMFEFQRKTTDELAEILAAVQALVGKDNTSA